MRQDPALTVTFQLHRRGNESIAPKILAWTTTSWTLPSNLALAVHPDADYALLEKDGGHWIIADASREHYAKELEGFAKVGSYKGSELIGRTYEPMFPFFADTEKSFVVIGGEFIELGEGTGVVHIAPAFGEDDLAVARAAGIPVVDPVDMAGDFTDAVPPYAGKNVFEANKDIIRDLKAAGKVVRHETYDHNYPHCWRTDQPLIYKAIPSWYVRVTEFRDEMVALNKGINWMPEHIRDGIFGNWLENARDWNIGRNRFWGSPVPVWKSDDPNYPRLDVYGSLDELARDFGVRPKDLHRPYVDELTRPNPDDPSGKATMRRVPDVLDCWFESGSMPFAQVHYPFENKEWFEEPLPRRFHRRICRADTRLVLHADGAGDGALRPRAVRELHRARHRARREQAEALQAAEELSGPDRGLRHLRRGCAALVHGVVAAPFRRRSRHAEGRAHDRRDRAAGAPPDLERLFVLHALREHRRHPRQAGHDGRGGTRPLHSRQDGGADAQDRRRDGRSRSCRGVQCAAAVHRGAQQLVHPPLARPVLEIGEGRRQAGGLRHALHSPRDDHAGAGAVPAVS